MGRYLVDISKVMYFVLESPYYVVHIYAVNSYSTLSFICYTVKQYMNIYMYVLSFDSSTNWLQFLADDHNMWGSKVKEYF